MFYVSAKVYPPRYNLEEIISSVSDNTAIIDYLKETCGGAWESATWEAYMESEAEYARDFLQGVAYDYGTEECRKLALIETKHAGFYGRSGGQFCFAEYHEAENILVRAEQTIEYANAGDEAQAEREARQYLEELYLFLEAVEWTSDELETMRDGIASSWPEYLKEKIEEEKQFFLEEGHILPV
jgi:DNA-dependent RNA polymerase auxiliary subunit epsilon